MIRRGTNEGLFNVVRGATGSFQHDLFKLCEFLMNFILALLAVSILPYLAGLVRLLLSWVGVGIFETICLVLLIQRISLCRFAMSGVRIMLECSSIVSMRLFNWDHCHIRGKFIRTLLKMI